MTIKISDLNEALHRIDTTISLVIKLIYRLNNLSSVTINNLVSLLKNSRAILDSTKDNIRVKGKINKEATK